MSPEYNLTVFSTNLSECCQAYLDNPDIRSYEISNCSCDEFWPNETYQADDVLMMGPPMYLYVYVTVINVIVFLVGILGNMLVIQVVVRTRSMHRRINYFLVSLSVADLSVLVVCMPVALLEFYGKDKWYIGLAMCKIVPFLECASHQCSVLTLVAIGCERYYGICHPLEQSIMSRVTSPHVIIPTVWVVSAVVSLPFAIISDIKVEVYYDGSHVDVCRTDISTPLAKSYIVGIFVACLCLPLFLLTFMYTAIILRLIASTSISSGCNNDSPASCNMRLGHMNSDSDSYIQNSRAIASRHQVVRMMIAVMILYFICLLPMRIVQLVFVFSPMSKINLGFEGYLNLINCGRILIYINSAGNPIIYGLLSSNFRAAFLQSFTSCFGRKSSRGSMKFGLTHYKSNYRHEYGNICRRNTLSTQVPTTIGRNNILILESSSGSKSSLNKNLSNGSDKKIRFTDENVNGRPDGKVDMEVILQDNRGSPFGARSMAKERAYV